MTVHNVAQATVFDCIGIELLHTNSVGALLLADVGPHHRRGHHGSTGGSVG